MIKIEKVRRARRVPNELNLNRHHVLPNKIVSTILLASIKEIISNYVYSQHGLSRWPKATRLASLLGTWCSD